MGRFRVMAVTGHATGLLESLEITGGKAGPNSYGGGIFSQGALTLSHDVLMGSTAGAGGGVDNAGRGSIDNFGGALKLWFATLSGSQGLITGGGFDSATGTILAGTGATPNCTCR